MTNRDPAAPGAAAPPPDEAPTLGLLDADAGLAAPRLPDGQVLAARYRIERFIAGGGMGEVYEAEDLQLGGRVALKVVRGLHGGQDQGLDRLKHEIQLARRVTHSNVCRLFEFGTHVVDGEASRPARRIAFLTMELLTGETLAARLQRGGPLAVGEALPLAEQMAAALAAAHQAGVVHRDFKSGNVVLEDAGGDTRVVVTDFGLAADRAGQGPLTKGQAEGIVGTPDYMAPEQIAGGVVGPATDVYAFGLVLYEMATGRRFFAGGTSGALKRLDQPSEQSTLDAPGLDRRWRRVIERCLAQAPGARYPSPQDAARELRGEPLNAARAGSSRRGLLLALAVSLFMAIGVGAWLRPRGTSTALPPPSLQVRRSLAVLPLKNLAGSAAHGWLRTALPEMLSTELAAGGGIRIVPGENVARLEAELGLPDADALQSDTLARIRTNLGADVVVLGSFLASDDGGRLRLDIRVQDARKGETIAALAEEGTVGAILELVSRTGGRLRELLGMSALSATDALGLRASLPGTPAAAQRLAEGLSRLRAFDATGARERLEQAVAAEPTHPLSHAALAEAWTLLGHDDQALGSIQRALELSAGLPREARLSIEARHCEASRDWAEAVRIYDVLFSFFPDNIEHGLRLASAQTAAGRGDAARRTIALLRRLPAPFSEDPRLDLADAALAETLGDFRYQLSAARRAAERGEARGERLLLARARLHEAYASGRLGRLDQTRAASDEARRIFEDAGDRGGLAWSLNRGGSVLLQGGHTLEARRLYAEALQIFEPIGYRAGAAAAASNLHLTHLYRGELAEASRWMERAQRIDTELGSRRGLALDLGNRALWLHEAGDLRAAAQAQAQSLAKLQELGEKGTAAVIEQRAADTLAAQGHLEDASTRYRHALAALRDGGSARYSAQALVGLGDVQRLLGDLRTARATHDEALRVRRRIGDQLGESESRLALARLALDDGRAAEAEGIVEPALAYYVRERLADGEALAVALSAESAARQGRAEDAARAAARALARAERSEVPRVAARLLIDASRASRLSGRPADAALQRATQIGLRHSFPGHVLEASLERALTLREQGAQQAGAELARVEREASDAGFLLLARLASQARTRPLQR